MTLYGFSGDFLFVFVLLFIIRSMNQNMKWKESDSAHEYGNAIDISVYIDVNVYTK